MLHYCKGNSVKCFNVFVCTVFYNCHYFPNLLCFSCWGSNLSYSCGLLYFHLWFSKLNVLTLRFDTNL
ncbi:hypothetical protein CW304_30995 [Bacillus sp. UFRGS-B20]|nr:hypothetical protein CW304_30995 [Bacillus sp. UFRGS-B20]